MAEGTMKAVCFDEHGALDVLEYRTLPIPKSQPGYALLRVKAVALNHLDIWVRRGWHGLNLQFPHITGSDIGGEIVECNGMSSFSIGDDVIVYPGVCDGEDEWTESGRENLSPHYKILGEHVAGGLAEYAVVPIRNLISPLSDRTLPESVAGVLTGLTTFRMLFSCGQLQAGQSVLVVGSGGGVNSLSVQMAKAAGAEVYCLAGSAEKEKRIRELGADHVLNYRETSDWHKKILLLTNGRGVDLVVDNVGNQTIKKSITAVCRGGKIVIVGNTSGPLAEIDLRFLFAKQISLIGSTMGSYGEFRDAMDFLEREKIVPAIDSVSPLAQSIDMLERLEAGDHFGKIVLTPGEVS